MRKHLFMRKLDVLIIILVAVPFLGLMVGGDEKQNPHVKVEVSIEPDTLKSGASGEIRIQFHPTEGIHVNATPPTELTLSDGSSLTLIGKPSAPTDSTSGYLDVVKPITYTFAVSSSAQPGTAGVNGTLVYYFCSDEEGWCLRWKDDVSLTVSITR